jgi:uncharacterized lipoprotein YbaY
MRHVLLSLVIALPLAGCQSVPREAPAATTPEARAVPGPLQILGKATYLERIAVPGARLEVLVIDDATSADPGMPDATVARAQFDDLRGPPYEFAIELDRARLRDDAHYSLRATLRDASGRLAFMTPARIAVTPGQPVEFRLVRAPAM